MIRSSSWAGLQYQMEELSGVRAVRRHRKDPHVVIIDDISRLARGLDAHLKLRRDIDSAGGILQSPSIEFGEDSDSLLLENMNSPGFTGE